MKNTNDILYNQIIDNQMLASSMPLSTTDFKVNSSYISTTQNKKGEWVPAIPEPYHTFLGSLRCECGHISWTRERYNEHYSYRHIYQ